MWKFINKCFSITQKYVRIQAFKYTVLTKIQLCFSLWELCEGNLEGDSLAGDPEGYVEKALEMGISFHSDPVWEPEEGLFYRGL